MLTETNLENWALEQFRSQGWEVAHGTDLERDDFGYLRRCAGSIRVYRSPLLMMPQIRFASRSLRQWKRITGSFTNCC